MLISRGRQCQESPGVTTAYAPSCYLQKMRQKWRHVMINTRCSWLHGDERGFRSRGHRIHSSGDYKHRPPKSEHEGLRNYHRERSAKPVSLELAVRIRVLEALVLKMQSLGHRVIAGSVAQKHSHLLPELPEDYQTIRKIVGKCKQKASHAVRDVLPGSIWSEGGSFEKINNKGHLQNTYDYIRMRQESGAVVWSHRPDEDWIKDPSVGVIVMGFRRKRIRVFGVPQTPASERTREDPDPSSRNK